MITAVDANIVLDILAGSPKEIEGALSSLRLAKSAGSITICAIAYAEVVPHFPSKIRAEEFFHLLSLKVEPLDADAAFLGGRFFDAYKQRGGKRTRILADFLIAAHAQLYADRLLTRDSRFFGGTFPKLKAVLPANLT